MFVFDLILSGLNYVTRSLRNKPTACDAYTLQRIKTVVLKRILTLHYYILLRTVHVVTNIL